MNCPTIQEHLHTLSDGERLPGQRPYLTVARHWLRCARCRRVWRRLRQTRRAARQLPPHPVPPALKQRVLASLPAATAIDAGRTAQRPASPLAGVPRLSGPALRRHRPGDRPQHPRPLARVARPALIAALVAAGVAFLPWRRDQPVGAAVEAAVQRANTWHLKGWRLVGDRRVPWEIWGRRTPFFYREQHGSQLTFDDGKQRIWMLPARPGGRPLVLKLASGPAPFEGWWRWMANGIGWRQNTVLRESPDHLWLQIGNDTGMLAPDSVGADYMIVDKRTWLPLQWEYRVRWKGPKSPEQIQDFLRAQYDVPLPAAVRRFQLPQEARVVDTLSPPADSRIPTENVQRARGLTAHAEVLAMDPDGNILVRFRCWLGNLKLGAWGTSTINVIGQNVRYRRYGAAETGYATDDGRQYVKLTHLPQLHLGPLGSPSLPNSTGDALMWLTPLEPRPDGAPLPRAITLHVEIGPQVLTYPHSSALFSQEFSWTLPLPERAAPIRIDDYLPPGYRARHRAIPGVDDSTLAGNIAQARAWRYRNQNDFERAIYWARQGLAAVPPFTTDAQDRRRDLAHFYTMAGDRQQAAAIYREVIRIGRDHPETRSPEARQNWERRIRRAQASLEYLRRPRPSRR